MNQARNIFPVVDYAYASVPSYPSGQIGFILCAKDENTQLSEPQITFAKPFENNHLRYYNSHIHRAAFVLPTFVQKVLYPSHSQ